MDIQTRKENLINQEVYETFLLNKTNVSLTPSTHQHKNMEDHFMRHRWWWWALNENTTSTANMKSKIKSLID